MQGQSAVEPERCDGALGDIRMVSSIDRMGHSCRDLSDGLAEIRKWRPPSTSTSYT